VAASRCRSIRQASSSDPREIEGVQLGSIQAFIVRSTSLSASIRDSHISAPLLFSDDANAEATIHDPAVQKAIFDLAAPKRMVGLATLAIGASDYGAKKPLLTLADFQGKKLRINGTSLSGRKWRSSAPLASACRCQK